MATRRPPSSRTRVPSSSSMAPPQQRSRSAMSKLASSTRSAEDQQDTIPHTSHLRPVKPNEEAETNIKVVIRCRRRSDREIQDNSPIIVSSEGAKSNQVSIETTAPVSTFGLVSLPPVRTYPFDLVFGPEADQAMVYHEVVGPMLEDVLKGYNCTLFAYGQTGTGKTYTMQGDLAPTPMGNPSVHAGMIPRVLFRLFHNLEQSGADFDVRASFMELYNEELRDLLASELSAPIGSMQPMGMASRDAKGSEGGLKIFDDPNKQGVVVQGLEEIHVRNSTEALNVLTKGSHRRQIAATKFNDHSSRSHSIFSLTIRVREVGSKGEELLKVGKLNLVDLAGSENVGRSGAENKRAREAGMINQSLLTLGRVINALVDKANHVPYRESKLTRLLQDSLGGCTKTCIIATVSPARSNLEETLSTLDYAMRAKSIRNKPELNQRMTRNALLKEYVAEIERLKADVLATREKNGIFFSEETWAQMTAEQELRQTEIAEAKKHVEIVENQMRVVREEFEQSIGLLMKRDAELKGTKEKLQETEQELNDREGELRQTKVALEEEVIVREAHQDTEATLDAVAGGLKTVAHDSIRDISGLFAKIQRKTSVLNSNSNAVTIQGNTLIAIYQAMFQTLDDFVGSSSQHSAKLHENVQLFHKDQSQSFSASSKRILQQLESIEQSLQHIRSRDSTETETMATVKKLLRETQETFNTGFVEWGQSLQKSYNGMHREVGKVASLSLGEAETALKAIYALLDGALQETSTFIDTERRALVEANSLTQETASREIARLKAQNEQLMQLVATQRLESAKAKDDLLQRMSSMLTDFVSKQDQGLQEGLASLQHGNSLAEQDMKTYAERHSGLVDVLDKQSDVFAGSLRRTGGESKRTRDGALKTLKTAESTIRTRLDETQQDISTSFEKYSKDLRAYTQATSKSSNDAFEHHSRAKRARLDLHDRMNADIQSEFRSLHDGLSTMAADSDRFCQESASHGTSLADVTLKYNDTTGNHLSSLKTAITSLVHEGTQEDAPTGSTPRKRNWQYIDHWDLTKSREELLNARRQDHVSSTEDEEMPAEENDDFGEEEPLHLSSSSSETLASSLPRQRSASVLKQPKAPQIPLVDTRNTYTTRASRRR
ncbi:hypothetical protein D9758_003326 [Tetrapyrgos nigripes]|uniref:Kinesin motor domain-containing protein n=1 Tax=Tetrapyrgos nigripes TaxID=182062 RepID=A0A8H5LPW5_9AGAR|nr:hypothetical protein D9758_003326 [Tetrapyrgos nigripes]